MKLSFTLFAAFFAGCSADASAQRRLSMEFMQAMHSNPKLDRSSNKSRARNLLRINEKLMKASRKLQQDGQQQAKEGSYQYYNNGGEVSQEQWEQAQWENGEYRGYEWQGQFEQGQAYAEMGEWNGMYWEFENQVPFDMTARAFKYSGCAAIKTYDVERAMENGNPMVLDTFAVFRLCPADKCNKYSVTGCGKNYGEYAIDMRTYLEYTLSYYEERFEQYCSYCASCDYDYQAEKKSSLQQCYQTMSQQQYQSAYDQKQQAWQNYYDANNGDMAGWNANAGDGSGYNSNYNGDKAFQAYNNYYNVAYGNQDYNGNGNRALEQNAYQNENMSEEQYNQYMERVNNGEGYWGADGEFYAYAVQQDVTQQMFTCQDGTACDYCQMINEQMYSTCDDYVCGSYYTYCSDLYGNSQNQIDMTQFLECTAFDTEEGETYFVGPHCGSDHFTISLGVFSDENCVNYVGEQVSLASVIGFQLDDEDLFKLPKECISCDGTMEVEEEEDEEAEQYYAQSQYGQNADQYAQYAQEYAQQYPQGQYAAYQQGEYYDQYQNGEGEEEDNREEDEYDENQDGEYVQYQYYNSQYKNYVTAPETDADGVVAVCRALYAGSAQCNKYMSNFDDIATYMSDYELGLEDRNCAFIDNILWGSYDETGEIMLSSDEFDFADWRNPQQYRKLRMPADQAILLTLSVILVVAMMSAVIYTQRRFEDSPWKPKRTINLNAEDLSRQPSGVRLARARSGPSSAPLI